MYKSERDILKSINVEKFILENPDKYKKARKRRRRGKEYKPPVDNPFMQIIMNGQILQIP